MGALQQVGDLFQQYPELDVISGRCRWYYGDCRDLLVDQSPLRTLEDFLMIKTNWLNCRLIVQPEAFFRRKAFEMANGLRENLAFCFDACLWMDMAKLGCTFHSVGQHWANLRIHDGQKTSNVNSSYREFARLAWDQLRENWQRVQDPLAITDEIIRVLEELSANEGRNSKVLLESTSYRVGRLLARLKVW
jgi:hypothetical protein